MKSSWLKHLLVAAVAGTMLVACTESTRTSETTGEYMDSSAITAKVKTALVKDQGLKGFDINVETFKDGVQLSGFVDTATQKQRATELAMNVPGVRNVQNNILVK